MKVLILTNNVKDINKLNAGISIAKSYLDTIGINLETTIQDTNFQFTGDTFDNAAVGKGACVKPQQILDIVTGNYKVACLVFDWDKVTPKPTNPVQSPIQKNGCTPIQIPEQWYNDLPEVFAEFFLHELCHAGYYFSNNVSNDVTHAYDPNYTQLPRYKYYLHLLTGLKQYLEIPMIIPQQRTLKIGNSGLDVRDLQVLLNSKGFNCGLADAHFGTKTQQAVKAFQTANGLVADGVVGPKTMALLNPQKKSKLDLWCEAGIKMEGANPALRNPGNIKCDVIMNSKAVGKNSQGLCIFPTYQIGYDELKALFIRACTPPDGIYKADMTLYEFYAVYAPSSDNNNPKGYAEFVAKYIGVEPIIKIKDLLL